jgi:transposase
MARGDLTDSERAKLEPLLPAQRPARAGGRYRDHRQVMNGMLWVLRTGAPWRDLPERYGPWQTCYSRFRRWSEQGVFKRVLERLQAHEDADGRLDWSEASLDGSYVKAHPHAAGAPKKGASVKRRVRPRRSGGAGARVKLACAG